MTTVRTRIAVLGTAAVLAGTGLAVTAGAANAAGVARCGNASLTVTRTYVEGGAGHSWMSLVYRNGTRTPAR